MSRHIDKEALVAAVMSSTDLNNEQKSQLIRLIREQKKYGLVWEDSTEDAWEKMKTSIPVLNEVDDKRILNDKDGEHYPNHAIIEADNLHALIALTYTHAGMIDVIYIDPPYNTGSRTWRYNNDYVDGEDGYRHSKWLSWVKKRLSIAKSLLKETGIIVVTIDDYEMATLKLLLDETFGEDNYLASVVIKNNPSGRSTVRGFAINHEYALYYSKSGASRLGRLHHNEKQRSRYSERDEFGFYEWENFRKNGTDSDRKDRPKQFFPIIINEKTEKIRIPELSWNESTKCYNFDRSLYADELILWPTSPEGTEKVWKYGIERARTIVEEILVKKKNGRYELYRKKYINSEGSLPHTWWDKPEYSARDNGTRVLTNIFGPTKVFDFPKAPEAVKDSLIAAGVKKDSIILDFFAGSGTTLHATMQLNAEDGGRRQCILVTNNENNICEEVTYERNKRVIEGYTTPKGEQVAGLNHNNLRYYKLDFNPRKQSHQDNRELFYGLKDLLCIKENIYQEEQQFGSLSLEGKEQMLRYFAENGREMLMVYDTKVIPFIVSEIAQRGEQEQPLKIYIFTDGAYPYADDFASVVDKVSLVPMPYAYYRGIKDSLPEETTTKVDDTELTNEEQQAMMAEAIAFESKE